MIPEGRAWVTKDSADNCYGYEVGTCRAFALPGRYVHHVGHVDQFVFLLHGSRPSLERS